MITIHQRYRQTDRETDRRTDRQTTCDRNTAHCTKVHRAVKSEITMQTGWLKWYMNENDQIQNLLLLKCHCHSLDGAISFQSWFYGMMFRMKCLWFVLNLVKICLIFLKLYAAKQSGPVFGLPCSNCDFRPITPPVSETVQDGGIVKMDELVKRTNSQTTKCYLAVVCKLFMQYKGRLSGDTHLFKCSRTVCVCYIQQGGESSKLSWK